MRLQNHLAFRRKQGAAFIRATLKQRQTQMQDSVRQTKLRTFAVRPRTTIAARTQTTIAELLNQTISQIIDSNSASRNHLIGLIKELDDSINLGLQSRKSNLNYLALAFSCLHFVEFKKLGAEVGCFDKLVVKVTQSHSQSSIAAEIRIFPDSKICFVAQILKTMSEVCSSGAADQSFRQAAAKANFWVGLSQTMTTFIL